MQLVHEWAATMSMLANGIAMLSPCKRHAVGVLICDDRGVRSATFNTPPGGLARSSCTGMIGNCGCVHAEIAALIGLDPTAITDGVMFSTVAPCLACANALIEFNSITTFIFEAPCRHGDAPLKRLHEADIAVFQYDANNAQSPLKRLYW